jgi:hypothetical protein
MSLYDRVHAGAAGTVICYHRGYLANDRKYRPDKCDDANAAVRLAIGGKVLLTQKKMGDADYRYLATIAVKPSGKQGGYWVRPTWPDAGYFTRVLT